MGIGETSHSGRDRGPLSLDLAALALEKNRDHSAMAAEAWDVAQSLMQITHVRSTRTLYFTEGQSEVRREPVEAVSLCRRKGTADKREVELALVQAKDDERYQYIVAITRDDIAFPLVTFITGKGNDFPHLNLGSGISGEGLVATALDDKDEVKTAKVQKIQEALEKALAGEALGFVEDDPTRQYSASQYQPGFGNHFVGDVYKVLRLEDSLNHVPVGVTGQSSNTTASELFRLLNVDEIIDDRLGEYDPNMDKLCRVLGRYALIGNHTKAEFRTEPETDDEVALDARLWVTAERLAVIDTLVRARQAYENRDVEKDFTDVDAYSVRVDRAGNNAVPSGRALSELLVILEECLSQDLVEEVEEVGGSRQSERGQLTEESVVSPGSTNSDGFLAQFFRDR